MSFIHSITAITTPQLETLLALGERQREWFEPVLAAVQASDGIRYVFRRHPVRAAAMHRVREDQSRTLAPQVAELNRYRQEPPRAPRTAARRPRAAQSQRLKSYAWVLLPAPERTLVLAKNTDRRHQLEHRDGGSVLKPDRSSTAASKELIHERYNDLALGEWAFRTRQTVPVARRPIDVRLASRTRGHALVVRRAYRSLKELAQYGHALDVTVAAGRKEWDPVGVPDIVRANGSRSHRLPPPRPLGQQRLEAARVKLPPVWPSKGVPVGPKKHLASRRKAAYTISL